MNPMVTSPRTAAHGPKAVQPPPAVVFVVDDDISVRESLELLLKEAGWYGELFASAPEFLACPRPYAHGARSRT